MIYLEAFDLLQAEQMGYSTATIHPCDEHTFFEGFYMHIWRNNILKLIKVFFEQYFMNFILVFVDISQREVMVYFFRLLSATIWSIFAIST